MRPIVIAAVIILLDQAAKAWIVRTLGPIEGTSRPLLGEWLSLTFIKNNGVAFGMFRDIPYFFTITSVLISIGAIYFYRYHLPNHHPLVQLSLGLILGGAIGNIVDRLRDGFVIDFIHVHWFPGIFNVADSAISVGVVMLAGYLFFTDTNHQPPQGKDEALLNDLLNRSSWPPQSGEEH